MGLEFEDIVHHGRGALERLLADLESELACCTSAVRKERELGRKGCAMLHKAPPETHFH